MHPRAARPNGVTQLTFPSVPVGRKAPLVVLAIALGGCAGAPPNTGPTPAGEPKAAEIVPPPPPLPPIPHVSGPPIITVVYPRAGATISVRDSNFILGSVGTGDATLTINNAPVHVEANGSFLAWLPVPDSSTSRYDLVAVERTDTVRYTHPVRIASADTVDTVAAPLPPFPDSGQYEAIGLPVTPDTDRSIIVRPTPGGTYKWFFFPGTPLQITGRSGNFIRVRLDSSLDAWISAADAHLGPTAVVPPPHRVATAARVTSSTGYVDLILPLSDRPPYAVEESGSDLVLTLYNTKIAIDLIQYDARDSLVRTVAWDQVTNDRGRIVVHLSRPPYGYLAMWDDAAHRLVVRIRRPPLIDPAAPLRGRVIAVDPGHPPIGATGPTGLWEPVATLAVGQRLDSILTARGARVIMTRTTADPVELYSRPIMARRANAEVLVSIHLNALPDGTNPFIGMGTGTYFFQPQSAPLARTVQASMVRHMGLFDRGIFYDNLALARPTWMPAILCEGAFIIVPQQEAALRTPEFQRAYAIGIADGLEAYFRSLAVK
jgi:N-acetylmuramoyl-L-alanine amidase